MRIGDFLKDASSSLAAAGVEGAGHEAVLLLGHFLRRNRAALLLHADEEISPSLLALAEQALTRRISREPLAYILGEQEFWSRSFAVNPAVLIPRPETELLIECALEFHPDRGQPCHFLDLGTGSGILAIVLACEFPRAQVVAVDRSLAALKTAAANGARHGVEDRLRLMQADWLSACLAAPLFDLVVANPPYVAEEVLATLEPEVKGHEPRTALDGGVAGMRDIAVLAGQVAGVLRPGGRLLMEIGADQRELVLQCLVSLGKYDRVEVRLDYAGLPRVLIARRIV